MKKCTFCDGKLVFREEKGYITEYDLQEEEGIDQDSYRSDELSTQEEYYYCDECDSYHHAGLILDGRNIPEINHSVFIDAFCEQDEFKDPIKFLEFYRLINFNFNEVLEFHNLIKKDFKKVDKKVFLKTIQNRIELLEMLIENVSIINFESLETKNSDDMRELCNLVSEVLGNDYNVFGKKDQHSYQVGVFDIRNNNELIFIIKGQFYFDYFLYGYWKASVERAIKIKKSNIKLLA